MLLEPIVEHTRLFKGFWCNEVLYLDLEVGYVECAKNSYALLKRNDVDKWFFNSLLIILLHMEFRIIC
jgi:hypothetical protein